MGSGGNPAHRLDGALVIEPRMLVLDQPGEGNQPNIVAQIGEAIRCLNEEIG